MAQAKKTVSKNLHKVILGDARSMGEITDGAAHLVVTSPPEWTAFANAAAQGIGSGGVEQYMTDLAVVWSECVRVLQPGCIVCVHIKDGVRMVYAGAGPAIALMKKTCEASGLDQAGIIIWHPEEKRDVLEGLEDSALFPRGIKVIGRDDAILVFRKPGEAPAPDAPSAKKSKLTKKEMARLSTGLWVFPDAADGLPEESFPLELAQRLIKIYSFVGETVLDPFLGGGTTVAAARDLGRSSIGYELNRSLEDTIYERVAAGHSMKNFSMEVGAAQDAGALTRRTDAARKILFPPASQAAVTPRDKPQGQRGERVPWKKKFEKDRGPKKEPPAQKEKKEESGGEKKKPQDKQLMVSITLVMNINLMRTAQGSDVRLLGVDVPGEFFSRNPGLYRRAMDYVKHNVEGKPVQARRPEPPATDQNSYYIYLPGNETVNGNLIRFGFALSDRTADHPLRRKFDYFEHEARKNDMGMWALRKTDTPR